LHKRKDKDAKTNCYCTASGYHSNCAESKCICIPSNFTEGKPSRNALAVELSARESLLFAAAFSSRDKG